MLNGSGNTLPGNTIKKGNFVGSWVDSVAVSGVGSFAYLPGNATFTALPRPSSIGIFSGVRASTGAGGAAEANIGVSAFAYGNFVGGSSGVWGLYSTVLRASGFTGYTHGMEIDVSNFGSNVALTPNNIVSPGQTDGIWLACGGEAATNFVNGISSVAIGILRNDPHALTGPADTRSRFGAAIVVHNQALLGTDGATGQGVFASLATGQAIQWTNNSNGIAGFYYVAAGTTNGAGTGIVSDNTGLNVQATFDNKILFNVKAANAAANYLQVQAVVAGSPPQINAQGTDTNIDIYIKAQGTGVLKLDLSNFANDAAAAAGGVSIKGLYRIANAVQVRLV